MAAVQRGCDTMVSMSDRGALLVARLHIDLALVTSAACSARR
jgi:hypothetical protein